MSLLQKFRDYGMVEWHSRKEDAMGSITDYRIRRRVAEDDLRRYFEEERKQLVQALRSRITIGLERWWELQGAVIVDELLQYRESWMELLEEIKHGAARDDSVKRTYFLAGLTGCGFGSFADAVAKLKLLRYAWRTLIAVEIEVAGEAAIHLTFRAF